MLDNTMEAYLHLYVQREREREREKERKEVRESASSKFRRYTEFRWNCGNYFGVEQGVHERTFGTCESWRYWVTVVKVELCELSKYQEPDDTWRIWETLLILMMLLLGNIRAQILKARSSCKEICKFFIKIPMVIICWIIVEFLARPNFHNILTVNNIYLKININLYEI